MAVAITIAGLALLAMGLTPHGRTVHADGSIALHNSTAGTTTDCPDTTNAYWHFVLAPNDGTFAFTALHLNIGGTVMDFSGSAIIKNGTQSDNVFIMVPAGHSLSDLSTTGSSADFSGTGTPNEFNLSSVCVGTATATATLTRTATNTALPTNTSTATGTPILSELTSTATSTGVPPSSTPTNTPVNTATNTPVSTSSATVTGTPPTTTPTATGTTPVNLLVVTNTPASVVSEAAIPTETAVSGTQGGGAGPIAQPQQQVAGVQQQPQQQVAGVSSLPSTGEGGSGGSRTLVLGAGIALLVLGLSTLTWSRMRRA